MKMSFATIALLVASALAASYAAVAQPPAQPNGLQPKPSDPFGPTPEPFIKPAPADEAPHAETNSSTEELEKKLQEELEIQIGTVPMSEFVVELGKAIETPVFFQPHPQWTEVSDGTSVTLETSGLPLEAELKKALRPLALRAIAHDDALLIIPDTAELARRGIGTSRYISIDDSYMQALEEKFAQPYSQATDGIPLEDAMQIISEESKIKFVIDTRALEDLGLTRDLPVKINISDVTVYDFVQLMLHDSDLTLMPRNGYVLVTTIEEAEDPSNQVSRVYWLDGTGLPPNSAAEAIETTIEPDTWEALGGPSTMVPMIADEQGRPTLLVTTTYAVHREIAKLLSAIRQGLVDPRGGYREPPAPVSLHGHMGGGMGGMGGGMGGSKKGK